MKKTLIAVAAVLACALTSCGETNYCYELTATAEVDGYKSSVTTHIWGTSNDLDAAIAETEALYKAQGYDVDLTYKRTAKSEGDCY